MTPTIDTNRTSRWTRVRRRVADAARTHAEMWAAMERIAPDPDPYLHWEPTTSGWRLFGRLVPPAGCELPPVG